MPWMYTIIQGGHTALGRHVGYLEQIYGRPQFFEFIESRLSLSKAGCGRHAVPSLQNVSMTARAELDQLKLLID